MTEGILLLLTEDVLLLAVATMSVVIGTWLIGELSPKRFIRRNLSIQDLMNLAEMKHDIQRSAVRWLSIMAASVVGAYKLKDVIDLIITAIK